MFLLHASNPKESGSVGKILVDCVGIRACVYSRCVCVCGWAGALTGKCEVFFNPQQNCRRRTQTLVLWQHSLKSLIITFPPRSVRGRFTREFDTISNAFFCVRVDQVQVLRTDLCVSLAVFPGRRTTGVLLWMRGRERKRARVVSMQQSGLDGSLISSFFSGVHATYQSDYNSCKWHVRQLRLTNQSHSRGMATLRHYDD